MGDHSKWRLEWAYGRYRVINEKHGLVAVSYHEGEALLMTAAPELRDALLENIGVGGSCEICWRRGPNGGAPPPTKGHL